MDRAIANASASPPAVFKDGLGERYLAVNAANEPLEVLALSKELTAVPSFEVAVREQVTRLATFHHEGHGRVRGVLHVGRGAPTLAVASDRVVGTRLSEILTVAHERRLPLEIDAALHLIRQLVAAAAKLHEQPAGLWHGAIAPERIVVTRNGRLIIVDHGLGTALEHLRFSQERYWKELRIALPQTIGLPHFDHRADVTQIGMVALALILGRQISGDDYPARIGEIADGAAAVSSTGGAAPLPPAVRLWLFRALQLDPRRSFASAVEAHAELASTIAESGSDTEGAALRSFLTRYDSAATDDVSSKSVTPAAPAAEAASPVASSPVAAGIVPLPAAPAALSSKVKPFWTDAHGPGRKTAAPEPTADTDRTPIEQTQDRMLKSPAWPRHRLIAAAVVLVALTSGATLVARRFLMPSVAAEATGTLVVNTNPKGIPVAIDGQHRGATPLTLSLSPGPHELQLVVESGVRKIPVTITAGGEVSQFIELPVTAPMVGQLQVRTEPSGAKVSVDGNVHGTSPVTVQNLTPGAHVVVLQSEFGSLQESVTIEAGVTASLVVPLRAPQGVPVSGWISVAAPADVQVYEEQRLLGSSRSERIMVSAGRHDLEIVNEALGYRATRTIQVAPGKVSPVKLDWPTGTLSINAAPWANVWIDGEAAGETPIGSVSLPIGSHTVVFRHPELGEQRATAVVSMKAPTRLSVDLRKK